MPMSVKSLGLDRLSLAGRIQLVEELWDSIAASPEDFRLSDSHRQDLQRRFEAHRHYPTAGTRWEEVRSRLRGNGA